MSRIVGRDDVFDDFSSPDVTGRKSSGLFLSLEAKERGLELEIVLGLKYGRAGELEISQSLDMTGGKTSRLG